MATPKGHRLDSYVTVACGPDPSGALSATSGSAQVYDYHEYFFKFPVLAWAVCHYNTSSVNDRLKLKKIPPLCRRKDGYTKGPPPR